jgi:hypothetical protein
MKMMEKENVCEKFGHQWKCYRKDRLTNDENTTLILFFRCKVCKAQFDTADSDEVNVDEKDYSEKKIFNGEDL